MNVKTTVGIMLTLFLTITLFTAVPVKGARPRIIIGVQGPVGLPHWEHAGMWDAAQMAADEINGAPWDSYPGTGPGIDVGGTIYDVQLEPGNEFAVPTPNPSAAAADTERLITVKGCQYIIGGFRTECTTVMIEKAMDYANDPAYKRPIFIIDGASTTELISDTVAKNYARYKYLFRVTPPNSTMLVTAIMGYLGGYLIPYVLRPIYGYVHPGMPPTQPQVDVAVLCEALEWTELIYYYLTTPAIYKTMLGPYANVTYGGRIPDGTIDCTSWLNDVKNSKARIMIHIFSGTTGVPLIKQWKSMNVKALPLGINVMAQTKEYWTDTAGACEGEAMLDFSGTGTPIVPGVTEVFWNTFVGRTGTWPIYTAWGAYESIYLLKAAIERADTLAIDSVVTELEKTNAMAGSPGALNGHFKFTPTHDVYTAYADRGPIWYTGYVRPFVVQWQAGRKEVLAPINPAYARICGLPSHPFVPPGNAMYPYPADTVGLFGLDGKVDTGDLIKVGKAFGCTPSSPKWAFLADVDHNQVVDTNDLAFVATDIYKSLYLPLPYCDETGKWKS